MSSISGPSETMKPMRRKRFAHSSATIVTGCLCPQLQRRPGRERSIASAAVSGAAAGRRLVDHGLDLVAAFVEGATGLLAFFGRDAPHLLRQGREQPVPSEIVDPDLFDGGGVSRGGGLRRRFAQRPVDFFDNRIHKIFCS